MTHDWLDDLQDVIDILRERRKTRVLKVNLTFGPATLRGEPYVGGEPVTKVIKNDQKLSGGIAPTNSIGEPAPIDGTPEWTNSNPEVLDMAVSEDGKSVVLTTKSGITGTSTITCKFDADLGEGKRTIEATGDVVVDPAEAVAGSIVFGEPEPRV